MKEFIIHQKEKRELRIVSLSLSLSRSAVHNTLKAPELYPIPISTRIGLTGSSYKTSSSLARSFVLADAQGGEIGRKALETGRGAGPARRHASARRDVSTDPPPPPPLPFSRQSCMAPTANRGPTRGGGAGVV